MVAVVEMRRAVLKISMASFYKHMSAMKNFFISGISRLHLLPVFVDFLFALAGSCILTFPPGSYTVTTLIKITTIPQINPLLPNTFFLDSRANGMMIIPNG